MSMFRKKKNLSVKERLKIYHDNVDFFNDCCLKLESALHKYNEPLYYANKWVNNGSDRIGVLFYDTTQKKNRFLSVHIDVFERGDWDEFAKKYCRVSDGGE